MLRRLWERVVQLLSTDRPRERTVADSLSALLEGETEIILSDGTRCDIVTVDAAIEVDWTGKWYEGLSQALHYASQTGKAACLTLVRTHRTDPADISRAVSTVRWLRGYGVPIFLLVVDPDRLKHVQEDEEEDI